MPKTHNRHRRRPRRRRRPLPPHLPRDVLHHIFARLPGFQDLLRCAATCRWWLRLVADPAFLRRVGLWPEGARHPTVLVGIFSQNITQVTPYKPLNRPPDCPPQFLSLLAGGAHLGFTSFVSNDDGLFNVARPLVARRGLLLAQVMLPASAGELHLAVCRPLIGKSDGVHRLPPPPLRLSDRFSSFDAGITGYALLAGADDLHHQLGDSSFRVLITAIDPDDDALVCVHSYSSATGRWSAPIRCGEGPRRLARCGPRAGVVSRGGAVHWMYRGGAGLYTLNVSADAVVSFTKIPIELHEDRVPLPCVAGEEGRLSFVDVPRGDNVLEIWSEHEEARKRGWMRSELVDLGDEGRRELVFVAESRGALLVEQGGTFFTVDLESNEKEPVALKREKLERNRRWFQAAICSSTWCSGHGGAMCRRQPPVLFEMEWPFAHRALVISKQGSRVKSK